MEPLFAAPCAKVLFGPKLTFKIKPAAFPYRAVTPRGIEKRVMANGPLGGA